MAALALAASSTEGERGTGDRCPAGEQCADETPQGLAFEGAQVSWFIGNGVADTAVGGVQTIAIIDNIDDAPMTWPFTPKVTSPSHAVAIADSSAVTLTALSAGEGYLRITRVVDGYLFDRLAIESRPIARMQARPSLTESWPGFGSESWAAYAGSTIDVAVALYDTNGGWLVDDSMDIASSALVRRTTWDAAEIRPTAAGTVDLLVGAGDRNETVPVTVTDSLTQISGGGSQQRAVNANVEVCFGAYDGSVRVFGAPFQFAVTGPATVLPPADQDHRSCVEVRTTGLGTVVVTAAVGNLSATGEIEVTSYATSKRPHGQWVSRFDLGERALASDE